VTRPARRGGLDDALARIDDVARRTFESWHAPGLAYGVIAGGRLVHTRGLGTLRVGEDAAPDARSVFRIASMTKSFTAATILSLRDEGRLRLDDEAASHVPELAGLRYPTNDSPPITIRHLLTMTAGLPTDDPWGDRQQGLPLDDFAALLRGGLSFAWTPGTRFEYSNLGYGILGRVITSADGREYRDAVRARILEPLGLASTGYLESDVPPNRKAHGYVWRDDAYQPEPIDGYGALASMGGLFSTVEDLAAWVAGFLDALPARDDPGRSHPLTRAARREMQAPAVPADLRLTHLAVDAPPEVVAMHYGFGLFQIDDLALGRVVGHGGGYPGYGSHMRWHPATGMGVVVLANRRYAPASLLAKAMVAELVRADVAPARRIIPLAVTERARGEVEALLTRWDDARAEALFAVNVDLDESLASRRAAIDRIRERHGALRADAEAPVESSSPLQTTFWLVGARGGRVRVDLALSPEHPPRVQALQLTSVPDPPPELRRVADRLVEVMAQRSKGGAPSWPADLVLSADVDRIATERLLASAASRFGPLTLGSCVAGDGEATGTFRLAGPVGQVDLSLGRDATAGSVVSVGLVPVPRTPPDAG